MPRLPAVAVEPDGLVYEPELLDVEEERTLVTRFEGWTFDEVRMHGQAAKRTVLHFGYRYDYDAWRLRLGHLQDAGPPVASSKVKSTPRYVEFDPERPEEVLAAMEAGAGWVNFEPAVDVEDVAAAGSSTFSLFSGRGPIVPLGTWTPATTQGRGRREPAMLGLQHPAGSKAKPLLAELGHPVPEGWVVVQDHVRKGLVVALPETVALPDALAWLFRAARLLATVPLQGGWRAAIYPT